MVDHANLTSIQKKLRRELPHLKKRYKVISLGVFGSYVRLEQSTGSDVDLLITYRKTPSLLKLIELANYLTDLLGIKVDLVMQDVLKTRIGDRILQEVVPA